MENSNEFINNSQIFIEEGDFATVGDFWKDIVYFYQHKRIYYITQGEALLYLKGKEVQLKQGHLYFIPSSSIVTAKCNCFLSHYYVHFKTDSILTNLLNSNSACSEIVAQEGTELLFKFLIANINSELPSNKLAAHGALQILISKFLANTTLEDGNLLKFNNIIQFIKNNLSKKITIKELAEMENLNEVYFSNSFSKAIGMPPVQYITEQKLNHAMHLLVTTNKSIKEICFLLGYSSEMYFSRIFKIKTGISPTTFKNNALKYKKPSNFILNG
jgi:AraC-like DNA-binding protein